MITEVAMMQGEEGPGPARSSNVVAAPPWLQPLLDTEFFGMCHVHTESFVSGQQQQQQSNHFCLDCPFAGPLCPVCVASAHAQHHVVQIRRSSYHDVIRVSEIQKVLNLGGIQSYVINSARVVFINGRPQLRHGKGVTNTCQVCDRSLVDTFRFCSLGCKLAGLIKEHRQSPSCYSDLSFLITGDHQVTTSTSPNSTMKHALYDKNTNSSNSSHDEDSKVGVLTLRNNNNNNNHYPNTSSCHYNITMEEEIKFMDNYKAKLGRLKLVKQNLSSSSSSSSYNVSSNNHCSSESTNYVDNSPSTREHVLMNAIPTPSLPMMVTASAANMCDPHTPSPTSNNNNKNLRLLLTLRRSPSRRKGTPQRSPMMGI